MSLLNQNTFFVKEHVGFLRAANAYDVLDPATGQLIGKVQETIPNFFVKLLKFTKLKTMMPFTVDIMDRDGKKLINIRRGFALFRSNVEVFDEFEQKIGRYKQRFWSLGGKFEVFDRTDQPVAMLSGNWKGWDFTFRDNQGRELGKVTKKWAGLGKELFTTADNYAVDLNPQMTDPVMRKLVLSASFCIDMVLKEEN